MNYQHDTIDLVRSIMAPANPVPGSAAAGSATDQQGLETLNRVLSQLPEDAAQASPHMRPAANRPVNRVVAPLGAALAIAGLVTGLTLVAQSPKTPVHSSATGASAAADQGMPKYYVTLSGGNPGLIAAVHDSQTGGVLSEISVPGIMGVYPNITADGSDRSYVLTGTLQARHDGNAVPALYRLQVSADGRSEALTKLAVNVQPVGPDDVVDSIAISPDGSELAVALQISDSASSNLDMRGEIVLYSLSGGPTRIWTAPGDRPALPTNLNWISKSQLAFVWQDQLRGSATYFFTGRSQIRVLDTSASGHDLLSSRVLLTGGSKLGFIQSAEVGPNGSPINVATFRVTSIGGSGTATMLLAQVSPNGAVNETFATYTRSYSGLPQEGTVTTPCQVLATDTTGQHTLATCPGFGRIDHRVFTLLAHSSTDHSAAW